jgi:cellulose biosynthesis protein BcsQ
MKGGVGKTTTAVNLAHVASTQGLRTLLWDLDPQGAATYTLRVKPRLKGGAEGLLRQKRPIERHLKATDFYDLDLLPADFSERHMDVVLDGFKRPTRRVGRVLDELDHEFELAVLDCPPGAGLTIESVVEAANLVLTPLVPTTLSVRTLEQVHRVVRAASEPTPPVVPFFSMVDRRKRLHRDLVEQVQRERPETLAAQIPFAADIERMGLKRAPVSAYAPRSASAAAFESMWREVADRIRVDATRPVQV